MAYVRIRPLAVAVLFTVAGCSKPVPPAPGAGTTDPTAVDAAPTKPKVFSIENGKLVERPDIDPDPKAVGPKPERLVTTFPDLVNGVALTPGTDGVFAALVASDKKNEYTVPVCRTATGETVGTVRLGKTNPYPCAMQADGKQMAVFSSRTGNGYDEVAVYRVADGVAVRTFRPEITNKPWPLPGIAALAFVGPDRLLAVNSLGGFDVHNTSTGKRLFGVAGPLKPKPAFERFTRVDDADPHSAVSADGKTLALFDGDGITRYDTADGKPVGRTDRFKLAGEFDVWGVAFRPDGRRLAVLLQIGAKKRAQFVVQIWDPATGKKLGESPVKVDPVWARFDWCGPDHLVLGGTNGNGVEVWTVADDRPAKQTTVHTYTMQAAGGTLWRAVREPGQRTGPYHLIRVAPPPAALGPDVWLYADGYTKGPKLE